jgi:uncharacterized protein (TIRG00374 family)
MLLVVEYLVLPQLAGARRALHTLLGVNLGLVAVAVVLEAASLLAYAQLTRSTLPAPERPSFATVMRIDLSTLAVGHVVPGGSAAGAALGYRLLTGTGVASADAGFTLATQGLGSAVVLNVLLWLGLVVSIPMRGFNALYGTAAVLGAALLAFLALVLLGLTRGEDRAAKFLCRLAGRTRLLDADRVSEAVHRVAARLRELSADRPLVARAVGWAAANWLLDAASLWIFVLAFGHRLAPDGLLVAYGLANVLAAVPITPGGLGITEAALITLLVGFGTPRDVAVLAVVGYRLVNFWLPIPVGAAAYVSLQVGPTASRARKAAELRRLARQSVEEAEDPRTWAVRHGVKVVERDS